MNGPELLAMFTDVVCQKLWANVCGDQADSLRKTMETVIDRARTIVNANAAVNNTPPPSTQSSKPSKPSSAGHENAILVTKKKPSEVLVATEIANFNACEPHDEIVFSFLPLLEFLQQFHNPLDFWDKSRRAQFPQVFAAIQFALAFPAASIFQESVFSSAKDTLTSRRKRLMDSPQLLEKIVILKYILNAEVIATKRERRSIQSKLEVVAVVELSDE